MNERAGNGRRSLRVRTHVRRERTTNSGGRAEEGRGRRLAGGEGRRQRSGVHTEGGGREREREIAARVRLAVRPSTREKARERSWFLARAEARWGSRVAAAAKKHAGKAQRGLKSVSARCTCHDAAPRAMPALTYEAPERVFSRKCRGLRSRLWR